MLKAFCIYFLSEFLSNKFYSFFLSDSSTMTSFHAPCDSRSSYLFQSIHLKRCSLFFLMDFCTLKRYKLGFFVVTFSVRFFSFFTYINKDSISLTYFIFTAFLSLHDNLHSLKFRGYCINLKPVQGDWAIKDTKLFTKVFFT